MPQLSKIAHPVLVLIEIGNSLPPTYANNAGTILDVHCGMNAWKLCIDSGNQWLLQENIGHDLG